MNEPRVTVVGIRIPFGEIVILVVQVFVAAALVGTIAGAALYLLGVRL